MRVELKIVMDDSGEISVLGPTDNRLLCYGLLQIAHDAIAKQHEEAKQLVAPATALPTLLIPRQP